MRNLRLGLLLALAVLAVDQASKLAALAWLAPVAPLTVTGFFNLVLVWNPGVSFGMLQGLGRGESESLIAERGLVEVGCEFCGLQYRFDAVDVGEMFTPPDRQPPGSSAVN